MKLNIYISIYAWEGPEWFPRKGLLSAHISKLGISFHVSQVSSVLQVIENILESQLDQQGSLLTAGCHPQFKYAGALQQMRNFLHGPCESEVHVEYPLSLMGTSNLPVLLLSAGNKHLTYAY